MNYHEVVRCRKSSSMIVILCIILTEWKENKMLGLILQSSRRCFKAHTDLNVTLNPVGDDLFKIFRMSFTHGSWVSWSSSSCESKLVNIVQICPHTTQVLLACRRQNFKANVSNRLDISRDRRSTGTNLGITKQLLLPSTDGIHGRWKEVWTLTRADSISSMLSFENILSIAACLQAQLLNILKLEGIVLNDKHATRCRDLGAKVNSKFSATVHPRTLTSRLGAVT